MCVTVVDSDCVCVCACVCLAGGITPADIYVVENLMHIILDNRWVLIGTYRWVLITNRWVLIRINVESSHRTRVLAWSRLVEQ